MDERNDRAYIGHPNKEPAAQKYGKKPTSEKQRAELGGVFAAPTAAKGTRLLMDQKNLSLGQRQPSSS